MLSQKEYNQLQYSEKKSIKEAKRTIDKPISQYSDFAQRVSLRSEKKQVFIDRNVQIKVFDENESQEVSKEQNEEQVFEDHQTDPNEGMQVFIIYSSGRSQSSSKHQEASSQEKENQRRRLLYFRL